MIAHLGIRRRLGEGKLAFGMGWLPTLVMTSRGVHCTYIALHGDGVQGSRDQDVCRWSLRIASHMRSTSGSSALKAFSAANASATCEGFVEPQRGVMFQLMLNGAYAKLTSGRGDKSPVGVYICSVWRGQRGA